MTLTKDELLNLRAIGEAHKNQAIAEYLKTLVKSEIQNGHKTVKLTKLQEIIEEKNDKR